MDGQNKIQKSLKQNIPPFPACYGPLPRVPEHETRMSSLPQEVARGPARPHPHLGKGCHAGEHVTRPVLLTSRGETVGGVAVDEVLYQNIFGL